MAVAAHIVDALLSGVAPKAQIAVHYEDRMVANSSRRVAVPKVEISDTVFHI